MKELFSNRSLRILLLLFLLAFAIRLFIFSETKDNLLLQDVNMNVFSHKFLLRENINIAKNVLDGKGFVYSTPSGIKPVYFLQMGYPLLFTIPIYLFGEQWGILAVIFSQMLLSASGVFFAFAIGKKLFGILPGFLFAFLWATVFPEAYFSTVVSYDGPMSSLVLIATYFFICAVIDKKEIFFWCSAFFIGFASLIKSNPVFLPMFFFFALLLWDITAWKKHLRILVIMSAIIFVFLIPEGIRHKIQFENFALIKAPSVWHGLWEGFGEFPNPFGAVWNDEITYKQIIQEYGVTVDYMSPEYAALLKEKVVKALREDPGWYITMLPKRLVRMILIGGYGRWNLYFQDGGFIIKFFTQWLPMIYKIVLLLFAFGGFFLWRKEWRKIMLVFSVYVYGILVHLPIIWDSRYLMQFEFPLLLLAALFLTLFIKKFPQKFSIFTAEIRRKAM